MSNVKPIAPPTIEEVDAKLAQIERDLKRFDTLVQEKNDWNAYRYSLLKVTKQEPPPAKREPVSAAALATTDGGNVLGVPYTVQFAEKILKARGAPMTLAEMLDTARKAGWKGSGEDKRDRERFYSAMHRQPDKFVSTAPLTWKLKTS
jgi:hypothetical protein